MNHANSHRAKKRFGQNFLKNQSVIDNIVHAAAPKQHEHWIEIGPGQGAITGLLLERCQTLTAIEIDRDLIPLLTTRFHSAPFQLIEQDVLTVDFSTITPTPFSIIGNLPYNISTPLLFHLFKNLKPVQSMYFMLQKEVALRICAPVSDTNYGRLSVMSQLFCTPRLLFFIGPESFEPAPKVDSAFIELMPRHIDYSPPMLAGLKTALAQAFNQRRKMLSNSLKSHLTKEAFLTLNIDPLKRPQDITVEEWLKIGEHLAV